MEKWKNEMAVNTNNIKKNNIITWKIEWFETDTE